MKDIVTKMKRIEWVPPTQTLEHFYYYEVPTRALSKKHFEYFKRIHSFYDRLGFYGPLYD